MELFKRPEAYNISYSLLLESIGCEDGFFYDLLFDNRLSVEKIIALESQKLVLETGKIVSPDSVLAHEQDNLRNNFQKQDVRLRKLHFLAEYGLRVKKASKILNLRIGEIDLKSNVIECYLGAHKLLATLESIELIEQKKLYFEELKLEFLDAAERCFAAAQEIIINPTVFFSHKKDFEVSEMDEYYRDVMLIDPRFRVLSEFVSDFLLFLSKEVPLVVNLIDLCQDLVDKRKLFNNLGIYSELTSFVDETAPKLDLVIFKSRIQNQGRFLTRKNVKKLLSTWQHAREELDGDSVKEIDSEVSSFIGDMLDSSVPEKFVSISEIDQVVFGLRDLARFFLTNVGFPILNATTHKAMLFELYDAFQQRREVINKFLEFSDNTAVLRNLSRDEIVHEINLLIKKKEEVA